MSVDRDENAIRLVGGCGVEDAEPLAVLCRAAPGLPVDLGGAGPLHTAVVQVLLELAPPLRGVPADPFAAAFVVPALERARAARGGTGEV